MNSLSRIVLVLTSLSACLPVLGQELYKHQEKDGTVTYSDRPGSAVEKPVDIGTPNVTTPESTRQINEKLQRQRTREAVREQNQRDSVNAAEQDTQGVMHEQEGNRAARRQQRGWNEEGDTRANEGLPR